MNQLVKKYLKELEKSFNHGPSINWTDKEYRILNQEIQDKTQINISTHTLKRIFGKLKYKDGKITSRQSTLDALAQYLDYKDWDAFEKRGSSKPFSNKIIVLFSGISFAALIIGLVIISVPKKTENSTVPSYTINPDTHQVSVPGNLRFQYDVSESEDSLFINFQTPRNKYYYLDPEKNEIFNLYSQQGIHEATISNQKGYKKKFNIVGIGENPVATVYGSTQLRFPLKANDSFWLPRTQLVEQGLDTTKEYWTNFNWYHDFNISMDSLHLAVDVENSKATGGFSFCDIAIKLYSLNKRIIIPIVAEGGQIYVKFQAGDLQKEGRYYKDIQKFTADMSKPHHIELKKLNSNLQITLDSNIVFESDSVEQLGDLMGIAISGKGSVRFKGLKLNHFTFPL